MVTCRQPRQPSAFGLIERFTFLQPTSVVPEEIVPALLVLVAHYYSLSKAAVQGGVLTPPEERQRKVN